MKKSLTYAGAGVDINKANKLVESIKNIAKKTYNSSVMGEIGGFGGLFSLNLSNYEKPVLVSSTDGVGTKLKIAFMMNKHDTIGIDLVGMCVNDIIVNGAKPLFFLDYLSMGNLDNKIAEKIVDGVAKGCKIANCALIGGETAEMPGLYQPGEYDLAGFAVGMVDNSKIIDGSEIRVGHNLIGIASSGLHSNGYSLARKICFEELDLKIDSYVPELKKTIGEELLKPTKIYTNIIESMLKDLPIHGIAHITGGGIPENIIRVIPDTCKIEVNSKSWEPPPIFHFLQQGGNVVKDEMFRTFYNGIGLVVAVPEKASQDVLERLLVMNEKAYIIGRVSECKKSEKDKFVWID